MPLELQIAVITVAVTAAGWLVTYIQARVEDRRRSRRDFLLDYTTKQLNELYGPITFLLIEGQISWNDFLRELLPALMDLPIFSSDYSPEDSDELKIWLFWAENDAMPRNLQIRDLLAAKTHLIEGDEMPKSFEAFLEHYKSWEIKHLRWKKEGVKYSWKSASTWPEEFENDFIATFHLLKRRHQSLINQEVRKFPQAAEEVPEGAEPRSAAGGAQEDYQRPWWRRWFGG